MTTFKSFARIIMLAAAFAALSSNAFACGGTLHIFMSEKAMDYVEDPELKQFLERNKKVLLWASWYPDSGYTSGNQYGEYSHWTPFLNGYIDYIMNDIKPGHPDYEMLVAHLLGAMSHSIEDQLFDHVFLIKTDELEGTGQAELDSGLDMVCMKEHKRYLFSLPDEVIDNSVKFTPVSHLVNVYNKLGMKYDNIGEQITRGQRTLALGLLGERTIFGFQEKIVRRISPWGSKHYYESPGGVIPNAKVVAAYWEAAWNRLKGSGGNYVIATIPEDKGAVLSTSHKTVDSNVYAVFSRKYNHDTINGNTFIVEDPAGKSIAGTFAWCYDSNLVRFMPAEDLSPKTTYKVTLKKEILDDTGKPLPADYAFSFTTP